LRLVIREEQPADGPAIPRVNELTFGQPAPCSSVFIVNRMRRTKRS
jgi:hypothetical protein